MRLIISVLTGAAALGLVPTLEAQKTPKKESEPKVLMPTEKDGCVSRDGRTECVYRRANIDSVMQTGADSAAIIGSLLKGRRSIADTYMYLSKLAKPSRQQD